MRLFVIEAGGNVDIASPEVLRHGLMMRVVAPGISPGITPAIEKTTELHIARTALADRTRALVPSCCLETPPNDSRGGARSLPSGPK